jgi:antitoxin component YwqK of YwqJK toxin-antitoxin module
MKKIMKKQLRKLFKPHAKTTILVIFILNLYQFLNCQTVDTIYYDKDWNLTDKSNFEYYRIVTPYKGIMQVVDYYKTGRIQMTGTYKDLDFKYPTGQFFYYRKNGKYFHQVIYEPFNYQSILAPFADLLEIISPLPDSIRIDLYYFKNGKLVQIGYSDLKCSCTGRKLLLFLNGQLWEQKGYKNDKLDGPYISYFENKEIITGNYKVGKKDGEWIYYNYGNNNNDRSIKKRVIYQNGRKIN